MKRNLKDIEKELKNSLDYIRANSSPIKKTSDFVWGKNVVRMKDLGNGEYERDEHELENWYISLPCNEETYVPTLVDCFKELVKQKDNPKSFTWEIAKDYTCHQLCDWLWLDNDKGEMVQNGKVTLVKFAIILKDLERNND